MAEQSREANKGDIEWDWVIAQWGNSRTRYVTDPFSIIGPRFQTDCLVFQTSDIAEGDVYGVEGEYDERNEKETRGGSCGE